MRTGTIGSFEQQLESMVLGVVDRELRETMEMPVVVDLMERHEVILSRAEGLSRPTQIGEFELAFSDWERQVSLRDTQTLPVFELDELVMAMEKVA
jgi:hypothetical protein